MVPQLVPSVSRPQAWVSLLISTVQVPALHRGVITARDCVPLSPQVPENPPHVPQAPVVGAPQSASTMHSSQAIADSLQNAGQGAAP